MEFGVVFINIFSIKNSCFHSLISARYQPELILPKQIGQNHQSDVIDLEDSGSLDAVDDPGELKD
jgi:hypothetical protein